jgi:hypothetical protein
VKTCVHVSQRGHDTSGNWFSMPVTIER